ncbi:MAG: hypothetical protein POELPBGB_00904 [Bacteroidia bacterium]|nr:hypothetical protein [Bacteroidia bacterium]
MKYLFILLFLSTSALTVLSQTDTIKVPFVAYWSIGDSYNFKITKVTQKFKEGAETEVDTSAYLANFLVTDSTATSYTINWSYENNLQRDYQIPEELAEKFSKYRNSSVIYTTDELGTFQGINNWLELSSMVKGMFNDMLSLLEKEPNEVTEKVKKAMQPFIQLYSSKESIESLVLKELQYFHFPFGVEFNTIDTIHYEEQLPNMFGGAPINGKANIYFETAVPEESYCVLVNTMQLDPEDTKRLLGEVFRKMGFSKEKEIKKMMKTATFEISDNNRYEFYYNPGIPIKIETTRTSNIDIAETKGKRIDKVIIEWVD